MKQKLLELLRERDGYISGQELCESFGVSRTAIWKHMQALKKEGYEIDSVSNKGYKLLSEPDLINAAAVEPLLVTDWAGRNLVFYHETDSTNIRAKELGEEGAPHGTLAIAEKQNAGRGRRGRSWVSPAGEAVYMTLLLRPEIEIANASMLTLVTAMAIARAVQKALGSEDACSIKWPNDIIVDGRKICGILTEMTVEADYIKHIVVGIGLNINNCCFAPEVAEVATSLKLVTGRSFSRAELIADIMEFFEQYYGLFMETQDMTALARDYNAMLINRGKQVRVVAKQGEYVAVAKGITDTGALVVTDETGKEQEIIAGEVSVRGVLGYV